MELHGHLEYFPVFFGVIHFSAQLASAKFVTDNNNWQQGGPTNLVSFNDRDTKYISESSWGSGDWSTWSNWSECTKTCDGGATFQYRQCKQQRSSGCLGPKIRYKLCNTQSCPAGTIDFRAPQCSAFNNIAFKGQLYRWLPQTNPKKPCALTCRSDEEGIVRDLAPKVVDGTRCRDGSLDMCINGVCMPVGCDLTLGSSSKLDACGVCGGDGSLCGKASAYGWHQTNYTQCSRPCGGGHQQTSVHCVDTRRNEIVEELFCEGIPRPPVQVLECNNQLCNPLSTTYKPSKNQTPTSSIHHHHQWSVEPWGPCTNECNGGSQARRVFCLLLLQNGTRQAVGDFHCMSHTQPATERRCNNHACPQWQTSSWSACSATCGRGTQLRTVSCVDHKGFDNPMQCDKKKRPTDRRVCKVSSYCPGDPNTPANSEASYTTYKPNDPFDLPHSEQALPLVQPNPYQWSQQADMDEALKYEDTPMYSTGPWSECSAPCGHGFRYRTVECKLYIKFSVKLVQLPDSECSDHRPEEREPCTRRPCDELGFPFNNTSKIDQITNGQPQNGWEENGKTEKGAGVGIDVTYSWHYQGYTECTRTCLGGVRHAVILCFRDHDQSPVEEKHCKNVRPPPELKQSCNDVPCPPRWNTSDFTACSLTCGGGVQTRTVQCVQEFGADPGDLLTMPMDSCPYPPPRTQMPCSHPVDCPAIWDATPWGSCSRTCGKGIMERTVICRQRMSSGDVRDILDQPDRICPKPRLSHRKSCHNAEPCSAAEQKAWLTKPSATTLAAPAASGGSRGRGKVTKLMVGNTAELPEGTDLRLKCPVFVTPGHPRPLVKWQKDGRPMTFSKNQKAHFKMSALGAVKIKSLRKADAGTYTCIVGRTRKSTTLTIIPRKVSARPLNALGAHTTSSKPLFIGSGTNSNTIPRFYANSTDALRILQTVSQKTTPSPFTSNALNTEDDPELTNLYGDPNFRGSSRQRTTTEPSDGGASQYVNGNYDLNLAISSALTAFRWHKSRLDLFLDEKADLTEDRNKARVWSKSRENKLTFEWNIGQWSACSRTCGGDGFQTRNIGCLIRLDEEERTTKTEVCLSAGLALPSSTRQPCGWSECPDWRTRSWDECEKAECFALDTAVQTRSVSCAFANGTSAPEDACASERPRDKRDCTNYKCKAVWTTGEWSQCTVSCGGSGIRSRILKCVWFGSSRPAGNMCRNLERPPVKESCDESAKCPAEGTCRDHFKYCGGYANSLKLCKQKAYRLRCCRTCSGHPSLR